MAARIEKMVTMSFGVSTHCQARMRCWRKAVFGGRFLGPSGSEWLSSPASGPAPRRRRGAMVGKIWSSSWVRCCLLCQRRDSKKRSVSNRRSLRCLDCKVGRARLGGEAVTNTVHFRTTQSPRSHETWHMTTMLLSRPTRPSTRRRLPFSHLPSILNTQISRRSPNI